MGDTEPAVRERPRQRAARRLGDLHGVGRVSAGDLSVPETAHEIAKESVPERENLRLGEVPCQRQRALELLPCFVEPADVRQELPTEEGEERERAEAELTGAEFQIARRVCQSVVGDLQRLLDAAGEL